MKVIERIKKFFKKRMEKDLELNRQEAVNCLVAKLTEMAQVVIEETKNQQREQLVRFLELFEREMAKSVDLLDSKIQECYLANRALALALVEKGLLTPKDIANSQEKIKQAVQKTLH